MTPVKRPVLVKKRPVARGPKTKTTQVLDEESESPQELEDLDLPVEESDDESQLEIERLRRKLLELEANQGPRNPLKAKKVRIGTLMRPMHRRVLQNDEVIRPRVGVSGLLMARLIWTLSLSVSKLVVDTLVGRSPRRSSI